MIDLPSDFDVWLLIPETVELLERNAFYMVSIGPKIEYQRDVIGQHPDTVSITYHGCSIPKVSLNLSIEPYIQQNINVTDKEVIPQLLRFSTIE
jgi:hypothetical protein